MSIDLNLLKTFTVFVDSKNIYQAAFKLGVSQPTISNQLRALEDAMELPIFSFKGKKKELTAFGQKLYQNIEPIVSKLEFQTERIKKQFQNPKDLEINIGARAEIITLLSKNISHPGKTYFKNILHKRSLEKLEDHSLDIVVTHILPENPNYLVRQLFQHGSSFIIHKSLLPKKNVDLTVFTDIDFLQKTPLIGYSEYSPFISNWCKKNKIDLEVINWQIKINDWMSIVSHIQNKKGYAIVPNTYIPEDSNLKVFPVDHKTIPPVSFFAIYHPELKELIDLDQLFSFYK